MEAIVIDDEPKARSVLKRMVDARCPDLDVIAEAGSIPEAVKVIHSHTPDLVFLDIDMPGQNGFALFDYFEELTFQVIFVTASRDHALDAFRVSALDYLLKPIDAEELQKAVRKAQEMHTPKLKERVQMLNEKMSEPEEAFISRIALSTSDSVEFVKLEEIQFLRADGPYTEFYLDDGRTVIVSRSIGEYDMLEEHPHYLKTHRSFLINLNKVSSYKKEDGGYIVMENGAETGLSRYKKDAFLEAMEQL